MANSVNLALFILLYFQVFNSFALPALDYDEINHPEFAQNKEDDCPDESIKDSEMKTLDFGRDDPGIRNHPAAFLLPNGQTCGKVSILSSPTQEKYAESGQYPWMAHLGFDKNNEIKYECGGSLINQQYILTAAHCFFEDGRRIKLVKVRLGQHITNDELCKEDEDSYDCRDSSDLEKSIENQSAVIIHGDFNKVNFENDIALIRLPRRVSYSKEIQPVCLPLATVFQASLNIKLTVAGWGRTAYDIVGNSYSLKHAELPFVSRTRCDCRLRKDKLPETVSDEKQFCLGDSKYGEDTCYGDSGGPAMAKRRDDGLVYQLGIISHGSEKCDSLGVYTKVDAYLKWILDNVRE